MRLRASVVEAGPGIAQIAAAATSPELEERHDRVRHGGVQLDEAAGEGDATVDRRGEPLQRTRRSSGRLPATAQARWLTRLGDNPCGISGSRKTALPAATGMLPRLSAIVKPRRPMQDDVSSRSRNRRSMLQLPQFWLT
jgi:hypothetical protein